MPKEKILRVEDVAQALGVSKQTVRRWIKQGKVKAEKDAGGHRLIVKELSTCINTYQQL